MGGGRCWQKEEGGEAEAGAEVGLASGKATTHMGEAGASHAVGRAAGGGKDIWKRRSTLSLRQVTDASPRLYFTMTFPRAIESHSIILG